MGSDSLFGKISLIIHLIRTTPRYPLIIGAQLVSGFASVLGLPLLVPVLNFMNPDPAGAISQQVYLGPVKYILDAFNVEPNFYLLLILHNCQLTSVS